MPATSPNRSRSVRTSDSPTSSSSRPPPQVSGDVSTPTPTTPVPVRSPKRHDPPFAPVRPESGPGRPQDSPRIPGSDRLRPRGVLGSCSVGRINPTFFARFPAVPCRRLHAHRNDTVGPDKDILNRRTRTRSPDSVPDPTPPVRHPRDPSETLRSPVRASRPASGRSAGVCRDTVRPASEDLGRVRGGSRQRPECPCGWVPNAGCVQVPWGCGVDEAQRPPRRNSGPDRARPST